MTLILFMEKKRNPFPLDNEWCDEKKERRRRIRIKREGHSKNYASPIVAIIVGHVTSLKQWTEVDKTTCAYAFAYLSMYICVPFAFSYCRLSSNNNLNRNTMSRLYIFFFSLSLSFSIVCINVKDEFLSQLQLYAYLTSDIERERMLNE